MRPPQLAFLVMAQQTAPIGQAGQRVGGDGHGGSFDLGQRSVALAAELHKAVDHAHGGHDEFEYDRSEHRGGPEIEFDPRNDFID